MRKAALICVVAMLVMPTGAFSQPAVGSFYVRGSAGLATQSLHDWNADIHVFFSTDQPEFEEFGGVVPFGIEAGYRVNPSWSLALAVLHQSDSVDNPYSDAFGSGSLNNEAEMTAVTANALWWSSGAQGLLAGVDVGVGFGSASRESRFRDRYSGSSDEVTVTAWEGSGYGPIAGLFVGYQRGLGTHFLYDARFGYQLQNLGVFDGTNTILGNSSEQKARGPDGLIETDFSGVQVLVGLGATFGGR